MALTPDELAQVATMINDSLAQNAPIGRDGLVVPGSYNPATATIDVVLCDTLVVFADDQMRNPVIEYSVPLATTHLDDAHGPPANALVHLIPTQTGYTALLYRTPQAGVDSPNVPSLERWISLKSPTGAILTHLKLMQNGASGDGLGGVDLLGGSRFQSASAGGHTMLFDDAGKVASIVSAGGIVSKMDDNLNRLTHQAGSAYALFDGEGNTISHVAGTVGIGALASTLGATTAAFRNADMSTFEGSLFTQRLTDLKNIATAMLTAMAASGVPSLPSAAAVFAQIAALAHIPVPSGSSVVKIVS